MMLVRPKTRDPTLLLRALGYSCLGGMTASGTLGAVKFSSIDEEGFEDRAYRLFYNKGQNRTDGFAAIGAAVGFAAAAVLARQSGLGALGGAAVGTAVGVAAHVATQPAEE
ncbi:hypothetical protein HYH03_017216 [Edaphochlamys debaryana]|uniref:Uncharacterized protein n=1 Tax=Edaphochlamys debaryana TaxID=47281 RepID=A0A836BP54_9CHLO|nr:hypothetical protein HYH03_017216 [Edaphochlamys debaryana]|eukprot:KAG2483971.1 hypothetical protein HYH03_017216 [Edaphochlamys debaryana]